MRSHSPEVHVVGIDDTDMPEIGGTGRLARRVAAEVDALGIGLSDGVTRHQLFEGPGVPKTARNSAAAIAFSDVDSVGELFETVCGVVARDSIPGSDPGVSIGSGPVSSESIAYARLAQNRLVTQEEARRLGGRNSAGLVGLGGTEDGVIGAFSAMALRIEGNDGRFVDLPGIREVTGTLPVSEVLARTRIWEIVDNVKKEPLDRSSLMNLGDWIRPRLMGGRPVLVARREQEIWFNADTRSK